MYDSLWEDWYLPAALPALEGLFFSQLAPGASVLDACCGCGHVTSELIRRRYQVTGADISTELLTLARKRLQEAAFVAADVRRLPWTACFQAALCTFDSLNHLLTVEDLTAAFQSIRESLAPGGLLFFDMNLEEAYFADLRQWHPTVREDEISLVRGLFDLHSGLARTDLVWFLKTESPDLWKRQTAMVYERCYTQEQIVSAMTETGWNAIRCHTALQAGVTAELGFGRLFFTARS